MRTGECFWCASEILVGASGVFVDLLGFWRIPCLSQRFPGLQCRRAVDASGVLVGVSKGWWVFLVCWWVFLG